MKKIGLTQRVDHYPERGEIRDALDQKWASLLASHGWLAVPLPNTGVIAKAYVEELDLDGIILTGGNDLGWLQGAADASEDRDAFESDLIAHASATETPLLAVCRGMQHLVARYQGSLRSIDNHVAHDHEVFFSAPASEWYGPTAVVNSYHGFAVTDAGSELMVVATALDETIGMVRHPDRPQWGVMWHPERGAPRRSDAVLLRTVFES